MHTGTHIEIMMMIIITTNLIYATHLIKGSRKSQNILWLLQVLKTFPILTHPRVGWQSLPWAKDIRDHGG